MNYRILFSVGEVITMQDRALRVSGMPDGMTVCHDSIGRVAVRNVATNRLSYIPVWRLIKARRVMLARPCFRCSALAGTCQCVEEDN